MGVRIIIVCWTIQFFTTCSNAAIAGEVLPRDTVSELVSRIQEKYNIRVNIYYRSSNSRDEKQPKGDSVVRGYYSFKTISHYQSILVERFVGVLFTEFNKYPVDFISKSGLKEIAFVADLRFGIQRRVAMPESTTRTLYFDVNYPGARDQYVAHAIHHEFFHLIYYEIHGSFYYHDPVWAGLNYPGFRYKGGGNAAYGSYNAFMKKKPANGFITTYATYGLEEDMAEVFAFLLTKDGYPIITYWKDIDGRLENKMNYMLNLMSSRSRQFDLAYLKKIHGMK